MKRLLKRLESEIFYGELVGTDITIEYAPGRIKFNRMKPDFPPYIEIIKGKEVRCSEDGINWKVTPYKDVEADELLTFLYLYDPRYLLKTGKVRQERGVYTIELDTSFGPVNAVIRTRGRFGREKIEWMSVVTHHVGGMMIRFCYRSPK
jgi:hypothetical protein